MKKRGQITLFIIIGIVLLLFVALGVYITSETTFFTPTDVTPPETGGVSFFIDSCIRQLADKAFNNIGLTGGYVELPQELIQDPFASIPYPLDEAKNPFWYHLGEDRRPREDNIKAQVNNYIEINLRECVNNLESFTSQFDIVEKANMTVDTIFAANTVPIEVNWPMTITDKKGLKIRDVEFFRVELPIKFKQMYDLATEIMNAENNDNKLEYITLDLIALDDDIPDKGGPEISCSPKRWRTQDVRDKLKTLLRTNMPRVRIRNTDHRDFINDTKEYEQYDDVTSADFRIPILPEIGTFDTGFGTGIWDDRVKQPFPDDLYEYKNYFWRVTDRQFPSLKASITFDENWPFFMQVNPSKGEFIESNMNTKGAEQLKWLCLQSWHFTYDLQFPVQVTISDPDSGYTFSFSFPVLIDHSRPDRSVTGERTFTPIEPPALAEYCDNPTIPIQVLTFSNASGGIDDIKNVNISYTCLKYACSVGVTEWIDGGAAGGIREDVPNCGGVAILRGVKKGYKEAVIQIQPEVTPRNYDLYLVPTISIENYTVVKHPLNDPFTTQRLSSNEQAIITIKRQGHEITGFYSVDKEPQTPLELLGQEEYNYSLQIHIFDQNSKLIGGYEAEWIPSAFSLETAREITFHTVFSEFTNDQEEFDFITKLDENSINIPAPEIG